jgi:DNA-binding transcriptional MerR regulator
MSAERGALVLYELPADRVTLEVLAERTGVHPQRVHDYIEFGLLEPAERREEQLYFEAAAVLRLRRIERLRRDLGVNLTGIAIILDMRDRLLRLQRELELQRFP